MVGTLVDDPTEEKGFYKYCGALRTFTRIVNLYLRSGTSKILEKGFIVINQRI
jgi:hypothetical protein